MISKADEKNNNRNFQDLQTALTISMFGLNGAFINSK